MDWNQGPSKTEEKQVFMMWFQKWVLKMRKILHKMLI